MFAAAALIAAGHQSKVLLAKGTPIVVQTYNAVNSATFHSGERKVKRFALERLAGLRVRLGPSPAGPQIRRQAKARTFVFQSPVCKRFVVRQFHCRSFAPNTTALNGFTE
jgi:hypothetical protein